MYTRTQPEAYLAASDMYIAKTSSINEELDALRHRATKSLFERDDVIVVASVSCIYGLGLPSNYLKARIEVNKGQVRHTHAPSCTYIRTPTYVQVRIDEIHKGIGMACSWKRPLCISHMYTPRQDIICCLCHDIIL
jgi:hypothetical protein